MDVHSNVFHNLEPEGILAPRLHIAYKVDVTALTALYPGGGAVDRVRHFESVLNVEYEVVVSV